jgi:hypothetical protein
MKTKLAACLLCSGMLGAQALRADAVTEQKRIGVLYLDSHEKGALVSSSGRTALETLATEAAVAIENARLFRESEAKARLDQEMSIAAAIQQALLPPSKWAGGWFELIGSSVPCRAIGGDFFDYLELPNGDCAFAVADVSGKGAPAALLTAVIQGVLASHAAIGDGPRTPSIASTTRPPRDRPASPRCSAARSAATGAGYERRPHPPFLVQQPGVRRLETGGTIVGLFSTPATRRRSFRWRPHHAVAFSDGLSEALRVRRGVRRRPHPRCIRRNEARRSIACWPAYETARDSARRGQSDDDGADHALHGVSRRAGWSALVSRRRTLPSSQRRLAGGGRLVWNYVFDTMIVNAGRTT